MRHFASGLLRQMTARDVPFADLIERWMLRGATLPRVWTAIVKATALGPLRGWRHRARDHREALARVPHARHGREQSLGVRVVCRGEERGHGRLLHDLARVHH